MADPQKTEKPTERRLKKAREEGNYPSARQFIAGAQFCTLVALIQIYGGGWMDGVSQTMRILIDRAFRPELTASDLITIVIAVVYRSFLPLFLAGAVLVGLTLAFQLAVTKMGFSVKKLAPDAKRLNPISKLRQLPRQNLSAVVQALILLPVFGMAVYGVVSQQLDLFLALPFTSVRAGSSQVFETLRGLLWKAAGLFFVFGCVDLFRESRRHTSELRMSKQEIKDEMKESEGNPQIKAKIRSIRRDQARRRMMAAVPTATAVIVNPTHFAVALKYEPASMAAPVVVAKGKNYLALRIRQKAIENQVPLIENPPLAQALYKAVDVGQEIPPHLYRAVAELLSYIFRLMARK
jgi:flagellar biosynthetic protein FlhB